MGSSRTYLVECYLVLARECDPVLAVRSSCDLKAAEMPDLPFASLFQKVDRVVAPGDRLSVAQALDGRDERTTPKSR